jgi:glycosyltransferase involved in cell wall biosynthesis
MTTAPAVSVAMSVYNGGDFLAESIESILAQTFRQFEFLIVDDASSDRSLEIVEAYAARDDRIRIIRNDSNLGLTKSLNRAINMARAPLIARHDADDVALPERFAQQVACFEAHPECDVVGTNYTFIDHRGQPVDGHFYSAFDADVHATLLRGRNPICHTSVMFRRSVFLDAGGYDERFRYAQDYELWLRLLAGGHRLHNLDERLQRVRRFDAQAARATLAPVVHAKERAAGIRCIIRIQMKHLRHFWRQPAYVAYLLKQLLRLAMPRTPSG